MKPAIMIFASLLAGTLLARGAQVPQPQNLVSEGTPESAPILSESSAAVGNAPDSSAYAEGVRAINASQWSDAITIFSRIADQGGDHADGALYWKAYAENKLGQTGMALDACGKLRREHTGSNWIEDCGALEIEIHAKSGQPVQPKTQDNDDLKLLALASLMQHDEKRALAQIDEILNGDSSDEKLKQGALFIMGQHHTDTIYPQIARISYMEGDVRVARGEEDSHHKNSTWEQAVADLPLESGFSLVTGSDGRAEIELEDASTLYLGENSVLVFNDLHTTRGIPYTELALLSGTVTLHVRPYVSGELFLLRTPTDAIETRYPATANFRVNSYTDGIGVTTMGGGALGLANSSRQEMNPGQTMYFKDGRRIMDAGPIHPPDFTAWDNWVADRFTARTAALAAVEKQSGLTAPIPGLADLAGKGNFFPCEPYGTCWEPNVPLAPSQSTQTGPNTESTRAASVPEAAQQQPAQAERLVDSSAQNAASATPTSDSGSTKRNIQFIGPPAASGPPPQSLNELDSFPCNPGRYRYSYAGTPTMLNGHWVYPSSSLAMVPWSWAECNAGAWIYRGHHYVWVVGRRHHHPPVRWVRYGHQVAFVPVHPHDVKDRPPVNRRNALFAFNNKNTRIIERIELPTAHPIELLKQPPKEFREMDLPVLPHAEVPHMTAHQIADLTVARGAPIRPGTPITFNNKSQSFMMAHQEMHDGRSVTVNAPMTNHTGNLQSRSGGINGGGGGWHGGGSSGGYHGSSGGSSSGGASHGGGSSSSSASSSSSGASSAASSSVSGSGGSHH